MQCANGGAGFGPQHAVDVADLVAARDQQALDFETLFFGQRTHSARPGLGEGRRAGDTRGQVSDRKRVGMRRVVTHDDAEIADQQEGRACSAFRQVEIGAVAEARILLAARALHAKRLPLRKRTRAAAARIALADTRRQFHFVTPGLARLPVLAAQEIGGRGQRLNRRVPDIALAVAVIIHGEFEIVGWNQLGVPHCPCP